MASDAPPAISVMAAQLLSMQVAHLHSQQALITVEAQPQQVKPCRLITINRVLPKPSHWIPAFLLRIKTLTRSAPTCLLTMMPGALISVQQAGLVCKGI